MRRAASSDNKSRSYRRPEIHPPNGHCRRDAELENSISPEVPGWIYGRREFGGRKFIPPMGTAGQMRNWNRKGGAMQLNEIGSRHSSNTHHVTNCMHDHAHIDKVGKMGASASPGMSAQAMMAAESQADAQFSLAAWLDKTLNSGRRLWGSIWGNGDAVGTVDAGGMANAGREAGTERGAEQIAAILPQDDLGSGQQTLHAPQIAAAASAIRQPQDIHNNPHFSPAKSPDEKQEKLWRRMRVKLQNMAGQFTGRSSGKSLGAQARGSSQTGRTSQVRRERLKEDLRRQSRSRRDELVINSVQTDDSYLLDSYDRKGAYSKLTARK